MLPAILPAIFSEMFPAILLIGLRYIPLGNNSGWEHLESDFCRGLASDNPFVYLKSFVIFSIFFLQFLILCSKIDKLGCAEGITAVGGVGLLL